jgi:hypothetical protein
MKRSTLICIGMLITGVPIQNTDNVIPAAPALQLYWIKKTKKEILRTQHNQVLQALDNSLHFVTRKGIKELLPFLDN